MDTLFFISSELIGTLLRPDTWINFTDGVGWDLTTNLAVLNTAIREWVGQIAYRLSGR